MPNINEKSGREDSAYDRGITGPEEIIALLTDRMTALRPRKEVQLKAYFHRKGYSQRGPLGAVALDFSAEYGQAQEGDAAYAASWLWSQQETDAVLNLKGDAAVWLEGELLYEQNGTGGSPDDGSEGWTQVPVHLREGKNELLVRCVRKKGWGLLLYVANPRYPFMWGYDYLLNVRCTLPFAEMEGLEGFAFLGAFAADSAPQGRIPVVYGEEFLNGDRRYRWSPVWEEGVEGADLTQMYGGGEAVCAYGLTCFTGRQGGKYRLELECGGAYKVFLDGRQLRKEEEGGSVSLPLTGSGRRCMILVKTAGPAPGWTMKGRIYEEGREQIPIHSVPFVRTGGRSCADWIYAGPFRKPGIQSRKLLLEIPFAPEREVRFDRPFPLGDFRQGYYRLAAKDVYVRPYLDTFFFGQWFYAVQVGVYGLFAASQTVGNGEGSRYFLDSTRVMAEYFDYAGWDRERFGCPSMLQRSHDLNRQLDPCGTIGVSMVEAYLHSGNAMLRHVADVLAGYVMNEIPRMEDGTYYRGSTMWADDFYMSCPFLVRMARMTGDRKYTDRVMEQVHGYVKRLYMPEKKLFSHIYFPDAGCANRVPWGRGNGWIAVALTELLLYLEDGEERNEVLGLYQEYMEGILAVQDESGMWHQVLDRPETYQETSCTAMFLLSFLRGISCGWLEKPDYREAAGRAWTGLLQNSIDKKGNVYGVCMGSGCSMESSYYNAIPTHQNDDHGTGVLLMAAAKLLELERAKGQQDAV